MLHMGATAPFRQSYFSHLLSTPFSEDEDGPLSKYVREAEGFRIVRIELSKVHLSLCKTGDSLFFL